ncbi:MAG: transposase [Tannerellaceae bacterium]|nr:transposase [Tannerellaceae bacterium]
MAQSLSLMYSHLIFHIKTDSRTIRKEEAKYLYQYMGGVLKHKNSPPIKIGGMPDHIHILCVLSKNISLSDLVRELKRSSTLWLRRVDKWYASFQ